MINIKTMGFEVTMGLWDSTVIEPKAAIQQTNEIHGQ